MSYDRVATVAANLPNRNFRPAASDAATKQGSLKTIKINKVSFQLREPADERRRDRDRQRHRRPEHGRLPGQGWPQGARARAARPSRRLHAHVHREGQIRVRLGWDTPFLKFKILSGVHFVGEMDNPHPKSTGGFLAALTENKVEWLSQGDPYDEVNSG